METNLLAEEKSIPSDVTVVRLKTSWWSDSRGIRQRKDITYLRRQCLGFNSIAEDVSQVGAEQAVMSISNFDYCEDGVYQLSVRLGPPDWESGNVEYWDYELLPITTKK